MLIKTNNIIKAIAKKYSLIFCDIYKYYEGNAYTNTKGEYLPNFFTYNGRVYKLKYVSGCFNPFLVECFGDFAFCKKTNEPMFCADKRIAVDESRFVILVVK